PLVSGHSRNGSIGTYPPDATVTVSNIDIAGCIHGNPFGRTYAGILMTTAVISHNRPFQSIRSDLIDCGAVGNVEPARRIYRNTNGQPQSLRRAITPDGGYDAVGSYRANPIVEHIGNVKGA